MTFFVASMSCYWLGTVLLVHALFQKFGSTNK